MLLYGIKYKKDNEKLITNTAFDDMKSLSYNFENRKNVIHFMGNIGFGATIDVIIKVIIFCYDRNIYINDGYWNSKCDKYNGISCYFSDNSLLYKLRNGKVKIDKDTLFSEVNMWIDNDELYLKLKKLNIIPVISKQNYDIDKNKYKEMLNTCQYIFKKIWKLNSKITTVINNRKDTIKIPKKYISIHVRMGDKIGKFNIKTKESNIPNIKSILNIINKILENEDISTIFVATDDYSIIPFIKNMLSDFNVITFATKDMKGYSQKNFNLKLTYEEIYQHNVNFLTDLSVLMGSTYFIGTLSSNIMRMVLYSDKIPLTNIYNIQKGYDKYYENWYKKIPVNNVSK